MKIIGTEFYGQVLQSHICCDARRDPNNIDSDSKGVLYNTKFKSRQVCGVSVRLGREHAARNWESELFGTSIEEVQDVRKR